MGSIYHQNILHAMFIVVIIVGTLMSSTTTWAGPYLRTSNEMSIARSTKECGSHAAKALVNLQKNRHLRVDRNNKLLGGTKDSTLYVECIFVGKNEQRRNQWIFHISIASTNWDKSGKLLKLLRSELGKFVRID